MLYNVNDIANKIILQTDIEKGDIISNLKLQKLLYYMQGYHLAFFGERLFEDKLEAWMYGPVVPGVYHRFKDNGSFGISLDTATYKEIELTPEEEDMFAQVMREYGKFSAIRLMEMTHDETPWKEAFESKERVINVDTMKTFFTKLIDA
ncbi:MAG: type II toxin-antitoxin system antitoxin SocA domain-containing protein [Bacteroidota bacterium]